jgi:predicted component of type VI protein secretion system
MPVPENIATILQELGPDVKAEVIAEQLLLAGLEWNEMRFWTDKFFYRNYSKDLHSCKIDDTGKFDVLQLHLSRSGIYDLLPEGLFFQPASTGHLPKSAAEMAEEYRQNKRKEEAARKFFSPLEHEFFYFRYKNFMSEKELLNGFSKGLLNEYFADFWGLEQSAIEGNMAMRIALLLPYVHRIAGDLPLMAQSLQAVLDETVVCRLETYWEQQPDLQNNCLGNFELGNELVCGPMFTEDSKCIVFSIEKLANSHAQDYLPGGKRYSILQTFYGYFVPLTVDVRTELKVQPTKEVMHIGEMEEAVLGIATVI